MSLTNAKLKSLRDKLNSPTETEEKPEILEEKENKKEKVVNETRKK